MTIDNHDERPHTWRTLWNEAAVAAGGTPQGRWVCEVASGYDGVEFLHCVDQPPTVRQLAHFDGMLQRLATGEPLQYVLGRWAFRRLDVMVDRRVLIPRPETEELVEITLRLMAGRRHVVAADLGCGSGVIGLSLATELSTREVWLCDASEDALDVARANAAGIGMAGGSLRFGLGSWFSALPTEMRGTFDVICSNPPYVASGDQVDAVVREWEPRGALFAGVDGLDAVRSLAGEAGDWLAPDGWLVVEHGANQATDVRGLLTAGGLDDVHSYRDAAQHERVTVGKRALRLS